MNKKTINLLLLAGAGVAAYFLFVKGRSVQAQGGTSQTDAAVLIAQAQADAAIAAAKAQEAAAEAAAGEWYTPLLAGIGQSLPAFAQGISGSMF